MEIALRDMKIHQMKAELENRKRMLCKKRTQLIQNKKNNALLEHVLQDYSIYNNHIINEKRKKIMFLEKLHSYIGEITNDLELVDDKLKESNDEQKDILKEITTLKNEMENILDDDNDINSHNNIDE
jgi:hypothetical protein